MRKRLRLLKKTRGFFDNDKTTVLYTDASPQGLGAVLTQRHDDNKQTKETTIECAAKSLTKSEKKYLQTQREALAIVWAVERFSHYLIGREFIIVTDHEPLEFIFVRAIHSDKQSITRAESWALRLSNYRFTMERIDSKNNIADVPSRLCNQPDEPYNEEMEKFGIAQWKFHSIHSNMELEEPGSHAKSSVNALKTTRSYNKSSKR